VCPDPACATAFPIVDGVPILVEDWIDYAHGERWMILRRRDLPTWMNRMFDAPLGDRHAETIRAGYLESFRRSHFEAPPAELETLARALPEFVERALSRHVPQDARLALDLGCATGGYTLALEGHAECAVGIDLHFERVRFAAESAGGDPRTLFLVANAETPPFASGSIDIALALNLVDSIARPRTMLEGLHRVVRPGGLIIVTTPFHWQSACTEPAEWMSETELRASLESRYEVLADEERLPWVLPAGERHADVFFSRAWVLRKP
jgi:SAM-dependent methyltransferase